MARRDLLDVWRPARRSRNPFSVISSGFGGLDPWADRWFDDLLPITPFSEIESPQFMTPACDIEETNNHYRLMLDMPGMRKEDIRIDTSGNQLTVTAERESKETEGTRFRSERYASYCRSFTLPTGIDADKIEANYRDGVLEVSIPKGEAARSRRISIGEGTQPQRSIKGPNKDKEREKAA